MVRRERHALTWEQVLMLADAMPKHRNLIILLGQTGMRIGEACGLLWKFVNLSAEWRVVDGEALPPNSLLVCSNWTVGERTSTKIESGGSPADDRSAKRTAPAFRDGRLSRRGTTSFRQSGGDTLGWPQRFQSNPKCLIVCGL
jgi:integrase